MRKHQTRRSVPKTEIAMLILKGLLPTDIAAYAGCDVSRVEEIGKDIARRHRGNSQ